VLADLVTKRGGALARSPAEIAAADGAFVALVVEDDGPLPALARLPGREPPAYLLKQGLVGGPEGSEGCRPVDPAVVARALDAALADRVEWEVDPDFGFLVAAAVPGIEAPDDGLLMPRFLYARNGRVYEYAEHVPRVREERSELLALVAAP
jgi:hypothetical protein